MALGQAPPSPNGAALKCITLFNPTHSIHQLQCCVSASFSKLVLNRRTNTFANDWAAFLSFLGPPLRGLDYIQHLTQGCAPLVPRCAAPRAVIGPSLRDWIEEFIASRTRLFR
jgi:hypothetical protein